MRTVQYRGNPSTFTSRGASFGAGGIGRRGQRNPRRCRQGRGLRFQFRVLRNQTLQSNLNHQHPYNHHGNFGHGMTRGISQSSRMYFELRRQHSTKSKKIAIPARENSMAKFHPHINSSQIQTENHLQSGFNFTHFVNLRGSQNPNPNPTPSQVSTHLTTIYEHDDTNGTENTSAPVQTDSDAGSKMTLENQDKVPNESLADSPTVVLESEIIKQLNNFRIN